MSDETGNIDSSLAQTFGMHINPSERHEQFPVAKPKDAWNGSQKDATPGIKTLGLVPRATAMYCNGTVNVAPSTSMDGEPGKLQDFVQSDRSKERKSKEDNKIL